MKLVQCMGFDARYYCITLASFASFPQAHYRRRHSPVGRQHRDLEAPPRRNPREYPHIPYISRN